MLPVKTTLLPTVSRFFEDEWSNIFDWTKSNSQISLPLVNIEETSDEYIIRLAAPGMKKEDFQVRIENNQLIIKSVQKENETSNKQKNFTRKEFDYSSFQRSFNLNHEIIDSQNINAKYQDGILNIALIKKEEAKEKPARQIIVK